MCQITTDMAQLTCCNCGITFLVPSHFERSRRESRASWYCPNGHELQFTESEADRLRRSLEHVERQRDHAREQQAREQERAAGLERSRNAYKGQLTRLKKGLS